jgi:Tfp pilus assembly protein PilN
MTQVNLLPPEVRNKVRLRRITGAAIGAVAAVIVLLLMVYVLQASRLGKVNTELGAQNSINAGLRGKVASLQHFATLRDNAVAKQNLVDSLMAKQILWSDALRSVSASTPHGVWFTSITGQVSDTPDGQLIGTIQFQGSALNHRKVAEWLVTVEKVKGWVNSWVSSSSKGGEDTSGQVTFNGTIDLSLDAASDGRPR